MSRGEIKNEDLARLFELDLNGEPGFMDDPSEKCPAVIVKGAPSGRGLDAMVKEFNEDMQKIVAAGLKPDYWRNILPSKKFEGYVIFLR